MADQGMDASGSSVIQSLTRHINCLGEDNRTTRKRALEGIRKETIGKKPELESQVLQDVFTEIVKSLLRHVSDPAEKCREIAIDIISKFIKAVPEPSEFLSYIIPVAVQRLGQQEIVEPAEELRLELVNLLYDVVECTQKKMAVYLDDMIRILQRTIVDPYPEVKKQSCRCSAKLAKMIPEQFHMQSESLIKPLLLTVSHQHSRVRVEVVLAIGDVIQYGNGKSVDDVVSHLAQRLFDNAPAVRQAVTSVVGSWLLDLMDRYSFHHKLIPLLLTSITDEVPEIQQQAEALWHDVGLKYEGENEDDLKDQQDFTKPDPEHYPPGVERPNLGCRQLVYRNLSKILPGLIRDLGDWVGPTRIKSASLLYTLLVNAEDNTTQHMEKLLAGLYRACGDEEAAVVKDVVRSAELIGYFVKPEIWCKLVLPTLKSTQAPGVLMVLAAIVRGSSKSQLQPYVADICNVLVNEDVCRCIEAHAQNELLACVEAVVSTCQEDCKESSLKLFTVLVTVLALQKSEVLVEKVHNLQNQLSCLMGLADRQQLYSQYTKPVVDSLQDSYAMWTNHSVERLVFDTLMMECGPVVGEILEDIIPMLTANLNPEKDAEVRLKFFTLLSRLMMNSANTLDSQQKFGDFAVTVVKDMILPNCVWKAGRTAGAIRTTAVSCLWALLQSGVLTRDRVLSVMDDLMTQLISSLEDDNKNTRLITCRVIMRIFNTVGRSLDQDRLHNMYPELLKRLDDSSDDIRVAVAKTFLSYFDCFKDGYDVGLYRAHLEAIYRGLLVHLDDPEQRIQEAILEALKKAATIKPEMLMHEVEAVRHKHRTPKYCDQLTTHIEQHQKAT